MFRNLFNSSHRRPAPRLLRKLLLEALEDRLTPSGYSLTELALPPGTEQSVVRDINSTGQVLGNFSLHSSDLFGSHAFLYSNGQSTDLGTLPGDISSLGFGINTSGQVVGRSIGVGGINGTIAHAFLYSNGQMTELNGLDGADAINDSGQIVGTGTPPSSSSGTEQAALYSNGTVTYLGSFNSVTNSSTPTAINASGQIVGVSDSSTSDDGGANTKHAFLYSGGKMIDLGTLPGDTASGASDINSSGQVVGASYSFSTAVSHAFLYSNGQMTDLGALPGDTWTGASGINSSGQVVGGSGVLNINGSTTSHAFLYNDGQMIDLNSLLPVGTSVTLTEAIDINDNGQILAVDSHGAPYLLTPQTTTETVISNGTVSPNALTAGNNGQQVTVSATVNTDGSPATAGNVVFTLVGANGTVVSDGPTGVALGSNGQASDTLTVPGGTATGSYSLQVAYTNNNQTTNQTFADALTITPSVPTVYSLTDLSATTGATITDVYGINSTGQVVGDLISSSTNHVDAFVYSNGQITDLGTLPGVQGVDAYGINSSGQVVGDNGSGAAFLYSNGQMTDLNTLLPAKSGWKLEEADAINDSGQIVGKGTDQNSSNSAVSAFLYSNGEITNLGTLPGDNGAVASAINSSGQVVGTSFTFTGNGPDVFHAFLYSNGTMTALGTLPGYTQSDAIGINDSGQVAGDSINPGSNGGLPTYQATLYSNGKLTALGTLPSDTQSVANGINSSGQVVGDSFKGSFGASHAFLYSNGQMIDLNSLLPTGATVTLTVAKSINDNGQIVADGSDGHFYLLTPQQATGTVISNGTVNPNALTVSNSGQQVTVSATVNTDGSPAAAGNVVFTLVGANGTVVSDGPTGVSIGSNGQASDTLTVPAGTAAGSYSLQVAYTNNNQTATQTFTGALNVASSATAPVITANPSNQTVKVGQTAAFTATASGSPTPTVQWQTSIDGGTTWTNINLPSSTTITVPNATLAANGAEFRAVFTNSAGSTTTSVATLTVTAPSPPPSVPPAPPAPPAPPSIPDQIQQMVQDVVLMEQSLLSGDMAAFGQELQDYVSLLVNVEMEIFQIVLNDFAQLMNA